MWKLAQKKNNPAVGVQFSLTPTAGFATLFWRRATPSPTQKCAAHSTSPNTGAINSLTDCCTSPQTGRDKKISREKTEGLYPCKSVSIREIRGKAFAFAVA